MYLNVFLCVFLLLIGFCLSQNDETTTDMLHPVSEICISCNCTDGDVDCTTRGIMAPFEDWDETTTEYLDPVSYICTICNCVDSIVECNNRNIKEPFELQDWNGIKEFKPISVDLSQNPLTSFTRISSLPIQTLNLSNCDIARIEDASFIYLPDLVTLDLSRNKISSVKLSRRVFVGPLNQDKGVMSFKKMRYLSLAYNDIHSLPQGVFTFLTELGTLDLSGNPLTYLDQVTMGALTDLVNLRELYMSSCELESLPDGLFRRQRLRRLDLTQNRFKTVPAVLSEARSLEYLNFGKNALHVLESDNAIRNLTKLKDLRISRNSKLRRINAYALAGLPNLVTLDISYNPRLTSIDPNFLTYTDDHGHEEWPMIKELYLNNNNLTTIDSSFLHRWDQVSTVDVSNNPYICDCRNQWMLDVLVPMMMKLTARTTQDLICKLPLEMRGLSFAQLHNASRKLPCPEVDVDLPLPDLAIILGIMIGIFVTFPLVLIVVLIWRRGHFARCRSRKVIAEDDEVYSF